MNRALFLDRDGTLIEYKPYLHRPDEVTVLPGIAAALGKAREQGYLLFLFTNQSGVGRGFFTLSDVQAVNTRMLELLGLGDDLFTETCIAPESPDQPSKYRKPSPRFIRDCILRYKLDPGQTWMVGDALSDWQAGLNAGIHSIAIQSDLTTPQSEFSQRQLGVELHASLPAFVSHLLRRKDH